MKSIIFSFWILVLLFILLIGGCKKDNRAITPVTASIVTTGKSYYVSATAGAEGNTGLSAIAAFKNISTGINAAAAGDTVFIMNGTYTESINITKSGADHAYITIKAYLAQTPKIYISGNSWNAFSINASYIDVEGIELQGDNANIMYSDAFAAYNAALAGGAPDAKYNTNGFNIGGSGTSSKNPHHVIIRNCTVHDFPGGGISSIQADYTTIEGNKVYNNAWYMMYAGSGISILTPFNSDAADIIKYKNIVRNNICYGNKTTIPWISSRALSDGNGIIIDVNQTAYDGSPTPYGGRTLVENNVSFNNGGSGIHSYKGDHTDIVNNTAYGNGTMVGYADIFAGSATDIKIANNIMYARTGGKCNTAPSAGTYVTYDYNTYYNGTVAVQGVHDKILNPQFINMSIDGTVANFSLAIGSPCIDAGTALIYSKTDIKGVNRPMGGGVDCGAYEVR